MGRGAKPWTIKIEEILSDGEEHAVADVVAAGAAAVPAERALEEMGGKAAHSNDDERTQLGAKILAKQSLMGMVRFGKATLNKAEGTVCRASKDSTSLGALAGRVAVLERQLIAVCEATGVTLATGTESAPSTDEVDAALNGSDFEVQGTVTGSSRAPGQVWSASRDENVEVDPS
jgi:hypothetical protein